jgi:hypothetical protein
MLEVRPQVAPQTISRIQDHESSDPDEPCTAEQAECTCPEFCERDHDTD